MAKTTANISMDVEVKQQAQELFAELGMDFSTAVNIFLRKAIRENEIPFTVTRDVPNAATVAAMQEAAEFRKHPERFKRYATFAEAVADIDDEDEANA